MLYINPFKKAAYNKHLSIVVDDPDLAKIYDKRAEKYFSIAKKGKKGWRV